MNLLYSAKEFKLPCSGIISGELQIDEHPELNLQDMNQRIITFGGVITICPKVGGALFCNCPISESPQNVIFHVCPISEMPQNVIFHVYPISEMPQNLILHDCPNYGLPSFFCTIFVT